MTNCYVYLKVMIQSWIISSINLVDVLSKVGEENDLITVDQDIDETKVLVTKSKYFPKYVSKGETEWLKILESTKVRCQKANIWRIYRF